MPHRSCASSTAARSFAGHPDGDPRQSRRGRRRRGAHRDRPRREEPSLRRKAIEGLGINDSPQATAALKSIYAGSTDGGVRRAVIEGLFIQDNAKALIELFRTEKDPALKREIVQKLGLMDSDEAMEFLGKLFGD